MEETVTSKFCCKRVTAKPTGVCTVEAGNAREAAIKAAPMIAIGPSEYDEDSILVRVKNDKGEVAHWRVSIQKKFTLDEE